MPRTPHPTVTTHYINRTWEDWSDSPISDPHREAHDPKRSLGTLPLANCVAALLPGLGMPATAMAGSLHTRAPWPVWKDSTTKKVKFAPLAKREAVRLYHKARKFERQTRQPGKQDGALGRRVAAPRAAAENRPGGGVRRSIRPGHPVRHRQRAVRRRSAKKPIAQPGFLRPSAVHGISGQIFENRV